MVPQFSSWSWLNSFSDLIRVDFFRVYVPGIQHKTFWLVVRYADHTFYLKELQLSEYNL